MTSPAHLPSTRRQFLNAGARYLALGGLSAYAIAQGLKAKRLARDPDCLRLFTCADCVEFSGCTLEKAGRFRSQIIPAA